jgi:hypothetical protein
MTNRIPLALTCLLTCGLGAAPCFADGFTPLNGWDGQIFPSFIIASASPSSNVSDDQAESEAEDAEAEDSGEEAAEEIVVLGDRDGTLGIEIVSPSDNCKIEVSLSADDWLPESTISTVLPNKDVTYRVFPTLKYKFSTLAKHRQTTPTNVTYRVKLNGRKLPDAVSKVVLHSINDCPFALRDGDGIQRIGFVYAAYVNEQHPFVDKILREALDSGIVDSFAGYQHHSEAEVLRQVYAVWHALSERDIRYSSITKVAGESSTIYSQHVRLMEESINNGQANCVDGSVLLASILRKIDIEPMLVMVPGHCFLAFALDPEGEHIVALETTMIGNGATDEFKSIEEVDVLLDEETQQLSSYSSFCNAFYYGSQKLAEDADKFESENETGYYELISIAAARQNGVLPISFESNQEMKSID